MRWDIHEWLPGLWEPRKSDERGAFPTRLTAAVACVERMKVIRKSLDRNIRQLEATIKDDRAAQETAK